MALEDLLTEPEKPGKLDVTGYLVWRCQMGHSVKDTIRGGIISAPTCPTCRDGGRRTVCKEGMVVNSFEGGASTVQIKAEIKPKVSSQMWDIFLAYLEYGRMRMADGSYSTKLCRLCVGYSHESRTPCACPCHTAREFLAEQRAVA